MPHSPAKSIFRLHVISSVHTHRHTHTHIHTSHTSIHPCIHASIHPYMHTYRHTDIQTYRHTDTHTHIHAYRHTYLPTYIYIYIIIYIHIIYIYILYVIFIRNTSLTYDPERLPGRCTPSARPWTPKRRASLVASGTHGTLPTENSLFSPRDIQKYIRISTLKSLNYIFKSRTIENSRNLLDDA